MRETWDDSTLDSMDDDAWVAYIISHAEELCRVEPAEAEGAESDRGDRVGPDGRPPEAIGLHALFPRDITPQRVEKLLSSVSPREASMIRFRLGLGYDRPHTLAETATEFNLTRERVRQIASRCNKRLSQGLRDRSEALRRYLEP